MPGVGLRPRGAELVNSRLGRSLQTAADVRGRRRVRWGWRGSARRARSRRRGGAGLGGGHRWAAWCEACGGRAVRDELPDAAVTVDRFHLIRPANRALTEVRRRLGVVERRSFTAAGEPGCLGSASVLSCVSALIPGEYGTAHNREGLGIRNGLTIYSADTDFARYRGALGESGRF